MSTMTMLTMLMIMKMMMKTKMMVMVTMTMTYSSTCADGTWKLPVYNNANKRLRYWSSDYKYRFNIGIFFNN